jgi:anaphase-promoting complex subunit 3
LLFFFKIQRIIVPAKNQQTKMDLKRMETTLVECVRSSLASFLDDNATFMAERLHATINNDTSLELLARCHLQSGKPNKAYSLLKDRVCSPQNRFLLGLSCFRLGKLKEGEKALHSNDLAKIPNGAAGLNLLGQILRQLNQKTRAIACFKKSLELDPFLWSSYDALCALGQDIEASTFFGVHNEESLSDNIDQPVSTSYTPYIPFASELSTMRSEASSIKTALSFTTPSMASPLPYTSNRMLETPQQQGPTTSSAAALFATPNNGDVSEFLTPTSRPSTKRAKEANKKANPRSTRLSFSFAMDTTDVASSKKTEESRPEPQKRTKHKTPHLPQPRAFTTNKEEAQPSHLRLPKLSSNVQANPKEQTKAATNRNLFATPQSLPTAVSAAASAAGQSPGASTVLRLLRILGDAYRHLCQFRLNDAISTFRLLPDAQYYTGWVLCKVAKAYFEMVNYSEAQSLFEEVRRIEPERLDDMELYSTILWHLRKEVELSYLAQELIDFDRMAPQSWCAIGNCFSLQKEHQTAIKFFQRATQIDPNFTYAYTLCGHEYVASDDLEKALHCFRNAIRIDERHYNAWYGMGIIFYRQEKYALAEYHFRKALAINNISSVLYCYVGMALHANQRSEEALEILDEAIALSPSNTLAKYKRACVLFTLAQYEEALKDLHSLEEHAPKEAAIFFLLGTIYKSLNQQDKAMRYYSMALDLDTKNQNYIKSIMDKLHLTEEEDLKLLEIN